MSKHTPGPWEYKGAEGFVGVNDKPVVFLDDDGACGDPECCGPTQYYIAVSDADARLIAAAPSMLDALRDIQSQCAGHSDEFSQNVWIIAEHALRSATGSPEDAR